MLKKISTILLSSLCFLAFGQKGDTNLKDFFSESEIWDLNLITDFLQMELCGNRNRAKFGGCIKSSLTNLSDWKQNYVQEKISWRKQKKLYSKISDSTYTKIWGLCDSWRMIEPKYEYETICFSQNEKFIHFLKALGKSYPYLEHYGKKLENVGSFDSGSFLVWNIIENPQNWNLEDRNVQIVLAIHFLTQNDLQKRNKKAIRLENRDLRKMNRAVKRKNRKKIIPNDAKNL